MKYVAANADKPLGRPAATLVEAIVCLAILGTLFALVIPAIQKVRESGYRLKCATNLRQLGVAIQAYHDVHHSFPAGANGGKSRLPFLGWGPRLLPFMEQSSLWQGTETAFSSTPNILENPPHFGLAATLPQFVCPADGRGVATIQPEGKLVAFNHYLGVAGTTSFAKNGCLFLASHVTVADISDGLSNTTLVGERPPSADLRYGWWYGGIGQTGDGSADMFLGVQDYNRSFRAPECPPGPYGFVRGRSDSMCDTFHFWSLHPNGANFLFCDGSVRFLSYSAAPILPALATRAGGEVVTVPD